MSGIQLIGLLGAVLVFSAFVLYNLYDDKISTGSWLLFAVGDGLDFLTYDAMTSGDAVNYVPATFMACSVVTFAIALVRRRFSWPDWFDGGIIAFDLLITAGWWQRFASAAVANITLQLSSITSFLPLYRDIRRGRVQERRVPWILWTAGNACFFLAVWLSPHDLEDLVYPSVAFATHAYVLWCIRIAAKRGISA